MPPGAPEGDRSPEDRPLADPTVRERLRDLPPSAKLVAHELATAAPLTQAELAERTLLPDRTVRYALGRLEDVDLIDTPPNSQDARTSVYRLCP